MSQYVRMKVKIVEWYSVSPEYIESSVLIF
jgi:hypothetical protein